MNKIVVTGIFILIFFIGLGVIISNEHLGFTDLMRSLSDSGPRILSILALPFIAILFVLGVYLRKKNEERKWKQALLRTRAKKQD
jgi:preprotein translocase subunit SecG